MLRKRVTKKRIFLDNDEKELPLKLGEVEGPGISKLISIVHPRTYQRWLDKKITWRKNNEENGQNQDASACQRNHHRIAKEAGLPIKHIVLDCDYKYTNDFKNVFEKAEVRIERTALRASNQNAFVERWIQGVLE